MRRKSYTFTYDRWLLITTFILLAFGLLMVASTSMVISDKQYGYPFHYLIRQGVYLVMGVFLAYLTSKISLKWWQDNAAYLLLVGLFLLVAVLIPGIGKIVNGSRRWIDLVVIHLQVSELAKLTTILYVSSYLEKYCQQVQEDFLAFVKPLLIVAISAILLLAEPDFGATVVLSMTIMILLFLSGVRLWPFILLLLIALVSFSLLAVISPYRLERLTSFLNPWTHQFDSGYQLTQSLIAFGRGGLWGVGLGNSVQKLFYLPEAHTDFLFAVIAEEWGLIGAILILLVFCLLVGRGFILARRAFRTHRLFSAYLAYGLAAWIGLQTLVNIGVNTGLLPTKGLTLPFLSYGGSSLLMNCVVLGILLRIYHELEAGTPVPRTTRVHR